MNTNTFIEVHKPPSRWLHIRTKATRIIDRSILDGSTMYELIYLLLLIPIKLASDSLNGCIESNGEIK